VRGNCGGLPTLRLMTDRSKALDDLHGSSGVEQAHRHIREGREHIAKQRALIARLAAGGHSTKGAEDLLEVLLESQRGHEAHLETLKRRTS
jgi:hypothetical protein